jgi:hypothetical protein
VQDILNFINWRLSFLHILVVACASFKSKRRYRAIQQIWWHTIPPMEKKAITKTQPSLQKVNNIYDVCCICCMGRDKIRLHCLMFCLKASLSGSPSICSDANAKCTTECTISVGRGGTMVYRRNLVCGSISSLYGTTSYNRSTIPAVAGSCYDAHKLHLR